MSPSQRLTVPHLNRRQFLLSGLASGLIVACGSDYGPVISVLDSQHADQIPEQSSWLHIGSDDTITVVIPSTEMGQGVNTSLAMLVCEELEADWQQIRVVTAGFDSTFNNPKMRMQITGGSTSVPGFWQPMRQIGAVARQMLLQAAASQWQLEPEQLSCQQSVITAPDGRSLTYSQLAVKALEQPIPDADGLVLKQPADFTLIGHDVPRLEGPEKVSGTARFGIDVQLPELRIATIAQSPVFGGEVAGFDEQAALAVSGVEQVINLGDAVAVIATAYWPAKKGLAALSPEFSRGREPLMNSQQISAKLHQELDQGLSEKPLRLPDNLSGDEARSSTRLTLRYEAPYLAHATLEPMNCTAHVTADRCEVWVPTQSQSMSHKAAQAVTGLDDEQVVIHTTLLGGGFGRRGESDFVTQAVQLSKLSGKPVKLIWSREEDTQHDFYRPATVASLALILSGDGEPVAWQQQMAASSIFKRLMRDNLPGPLSLLPVTSVIGDPVAAEGGKAVPYLSPEYGESEFKHHIVDLPVPVGFWRSVGHSHNAFFVESAIDEAAHQLGADPLNYRRRLLSEHPRLLAVLNRVAVLSRWGHAPTGRAQGVAVHESFGSYVAQVVELELMADNQLRLHHIWCAADCGLVVNPDTLKAQLEGGLIFGLVAAAEGEITISEGQVVQSNFHDYPLLRMSHVPDITVELIASDEPPGGGGEPGTPPIAPALTNALFAAGGERVRTLPLSRAGYRLTAGRL